jgi:superfamily II DNA or RNA helicase
MSVNFDLDVKKNKGILRGDHFDAIMEHFSYENPGARHARRRGSYAIHRKHMITPAGRFDLGLYFEIRKMLNKQYPDTRITQDERFNNAILPKYEFAANMNRLILPGREYQSDIVERLLKIGRGIAVLGTGGGKTLTMAYLIQTIYDNWHDRSSFRCLVIVPDLGLKNQTYDDFNEYGVSFLASKWEGKAIPGTPVTIANMGILQSKKSDVSWLEHVDLLIVDEVHKLRKDNKINKLLDQCKTNNRFGFTGTEAEKHEDRWNAIGKIGPVLYEKDTYSLRKEKYLTNAKVQIIKLDYAKQPDPVPKAERNNPTAKYQKEIEFVQNSKFRNDIIGNLAKNFDNNALIMVDRIQHGQKVYDAVVEKCPDKKVFFVRGDVDVEQRDRIKALMERDTNIVVIAISKIFSTGINIKNLHYVVFASGGKAKVTIIQAIGRGLRLHENKDLLIIIDIADILKYGYDHMQKRIKLYKKERIEYGITTIKESPGRKASQKKKS